MVGRDGRRESSDAEWRHAMRRSRAVPLTDPQDVKEAELRPATAARALRWTPDDRQAETEAPARVRVMARPLIVKSTPA